MNIATLTSDDFTPLLNQIFRIRYNEADWIEVELIAVTPLGDENNPAVDPSRRRAFSLLFRGQQKGYLPQRIYTLEHERLGSLELFFVPLGLDGEGVRYEVIFN
jgi:hypothetical protein